MVSLLVFFFKGKPMRKDESKISSSNECKKVHRIAAAEAAQNNTLCSIASLSERSAHYSHSDEHASKTHFAF